MRSRLGERHPGQPAGSRSRRGQRGVTLIELMISITLGLIILVAVLVIFNQNSRSFRQNDAAAEMQNNARFAMEALARDLALAGFYGGMFNASDILPNATQTATSATTTPPANDCGGLDSNGIPWSFQAYKRLEFADNVTSAATAASFFPCLANASAGFYPGTANTAGTTPGTDIVALRRAAGQYAAAWTTGSFPSSSLSGFTYYLQSNGTQASIVREGSAPAQDGTGLPTTPPMSFFKWVPRVYYIGSYTTSAGTIPSLCRMELQHTATPNMLSECIATGIEDLEIEWGLDIDSNCIPDTYTNQPTSSQSPSQVAVPAGGQPQLQNMAVSARIWLLVRSPTPDGGYVDTKTYSLAGKPAVSFGDHFHRRIYSTTVQLRNPIGVNTNGSCNYSR